MESDKRVELDQIFREHTVKIKTGRQDMWVYIMGSSVSGIGSISGLALFGSMVSVANSWSWWSLLIALISIPHSVYHLTFTLIPKSLPSI
ncbi:hypothetical protein BC828DRAFT_385852 [Blastocladiella britannica]|nr:hypothetical protein BC828DRAFT_385852 [Blastocladiella britannica]